MPSPRTASSASASQLCRLGSLMRQAAIRPWVSVSRTWHVSPRHPRSANASESGAGERHQVQGQASGDIVRQQAVDISGRLQHLAAAPSDAPSRRRGV